MQTQTGDPAAARSTTGLEVRHHTADAALLQPVVFEKEYVNAMSDPADEKQSQVRSEVLRLQSEYGRYVAYGLRLQIPASTRRVLLFVSSVLGGQESKLSMVGLERVEKSLRLFKIKVENLQEEQLLQSIGQKRSAEEASPAVETPKRFKSGKPAPIDTAPSLLQGDLAPTTLSPATQRVLALPGVSPTSVMTPGRRKVLNKVLSENKEAASAMKQAESQQHVFFGHGILEEPIKFNSSVIANGP